jgi:hypothetical protein
MYCSNIVTVKNLLGHLFIENVTAHYVRFFRVADYDTDHYLVVAVAMSTQHTDLIWRGSISRN